MAALIFISLSMPPRSGSICLFIFHSNADYSRNVAFMAVLVTFCAQLQLSSVFVALQMPFRTRLGDDSFFELNYATELLAPGRRV